MPDRSRPWGNGAGWIHVDAKGRKTYIIRKRLGGKQYEVSTKASTERRAYEQLAIFEADPANYRPGGSGRGAVLLRAELAAQFLAWSRDEKHNSPRHVQNQHAAMVWWIERLGAVDLSRLAPSTVVAALDTAKRARTGKIATIKTFYSWLRRVRHALQNDPTETLSVPQARPEQWRKDKVIPVEHYRAVRAHLADPWLAAVDVLAGTGWHVSEMMRFATGGRVDGNVLTCPQTKGGAPLRTQVSDAVADAAGRLLGTVVDYFDFRDALIAASTAAGLAEYVHPGRFRHSVATWAINAGADPAAVAAFLGHKSSATTRRFYATHAVPPKVPTLL